MSYLASKNMKCNNSYQQQLNRKLKTPEFYPGATMAVTSGMLSKPEPWEGRGASWENNLPPEIGLTGLTHPPKSGWAKTPLHPHRL